jgi:hypothetical protein
MIISATSPTPPAETITVSFSNPTNTGTSGQSVSFTASAASSLGDSLQYNFIWGDGTSTGFGSASTQLHTYNTTTTQAYTVIVQAKCPTHSVSGQASTPITITGSGGGGSGSGTITNPIKLNKTMDMVAKGYMSQSSSDGTMGTVNLPKNTKLYFEVDTFATIGTSASSFGLNTKFYNNTFSVCKVLYDKRTQTPLAPEVCGYPSTYRDLVPDVSKGGPNELDNYRYLYGIDNSRGATNFSIDVWVTINP